LVSVTDCAGLVAPTTWVVKVMLGREKVTFGPDVTPVPVKATDCGLTTASSVIVTAAVRGPTRVGLKVTLTVQLAPGETLVPQVFAWLKSAAFVPVMLRLVILRVK
jgi:hypothetical protein